MLRTCRCACSRFSMVLMLAGGLSHTLLICSKHSRRDSPFSPAVATSSSSVCSRVRGAVTVGTALPSRLASSTQYLPVGLKLGDFRVKPGDFDCDGIQRCHRGAVVLR